MKLIDVDKLLFSLEEWELNETPISTYSKPKEFTADDMQRMIWRTIRDCESAVEEQPTVKAIPIEWLNKRVEEIVFAYWTKARNKMTLPLNELPLLIDQIIGEWEKENEKG